MLKRFVKMTFVQSVYFILKLLEMAQQNIFHVAAGSRFAPADNRYNTHQLFMCGAADVQRLSVGQFHFLEIGFPIVTRSIFCFFSSSFLIFFLSDIDLFSSLFAYPISPWTINTRSSSGRIYVRYNRIQSGTFRPSPLLASAW